MVELQIMSGPFDGQTVRLITPNNRHPELGNGYILGRKENCDWAIPWDRWVSGRHMRLFQQDGGWHVQDLNSTNHSYIAQLRADGSYSGKARIETVISIFPGSLIQIGRLWIKIQKA